MSTQYVGPLFYLHEEARQFHGEIRVNTDEIDEEDVIAQVGIYDFDQGDEYGSFDLTRDHAERLRDALTNVLQEGKTS